MATMADSIDPASFSAGLAVGESVTIRKTVTIDDAPPTSGVIDVMFLIDTSGSMGGEIAAAKAAAGSILSGLSGFGDLATGTGFYSDPGFNGVFRDLTTNAAQGVADINAINLFMGGGGGDFPEKGFAATKQAAENASWRPGSSRFIIALGDANFKETDGATLANTLAALDDNDITFIGIDYGSGSFRMTTNGFGGLDPTPLAAGTGGSISPASGLDPGDVVADILASVTAAFSEYDEVTVNDLGAGLPGIGVSVDCVSADIGACAGDTAVGDFDRSVVRTFEFDVTFTGLAPGDWAFPTLALVDGGTVAVERDRFRVGEGDPIPEPSTILLFGTGLLGLSFIGRKKRD
jgi:hypothetical protein